MAFRNGIVLFLLIGLTAGLAGCGAGSTATNSNSASGGAVSIAFQSAPVTGISINQTATLTAVVSNDPNNYGVDWCVATATYACGMCPADQCGRLSVLHTQSGKLVGYSPPPTVTDNRLRVSVIAFATADHSKNLVAPLEVTGYAGELKGTYVFYAKGSHSYTDNAGNAREQLYQIAGAVTLDGDAGKVLAGEQTYTLSSGPGWASITGGGYSLGKDGRGTLTLQTSDPTIGSNGTESFSLVRISGSQALIAQNDNFAVATGTMDLQDAQIGSVIPANGYALALSGMGAKGRPIALGGILNIDQPADGGISGSGSLLDVADLSVNQGKVRNCPAPASPAGLPGISQPDLFGQVKLNLTACPAAGKVLRLAFTGYMINSSQVKLVETDVNLGSAGAGFSTGGTALGQGTNTGGFTSAQFSGSYVFGISGFDATAADASLAAAGIFTPNGSGSLAGTTDEVTFSEIANLSSSISSDFSGNYTIGAAGRVDVPAVTYSGASGSQPELILYLTGSGTPALLLHSDPTAADVGAGIAYPQGAALKFDGTYGFNGVYGTSGDSGVYAAGSSDWTEDSVTGQMTATASTATIDGWADGFAGLSPEWIGTFQPPSGNGPFAGSLSVQSTALDSASVNYYLVDSGHGFFVQTNPENSAYSTFLGYFAAQTPVCAGCQ